MCTSCLHTCNSVHHNIISLHLYSLQLSLLICLMSRSRPHSPSASIRVHRSSSASFRKSPRSPRPSSRVNSRASSLHSEICKGEQFHCVPGSQVFHPDGSVRTHYVSKIEAAHVMLPDGTSQRYEEFCQKCSSPIAGERVKVNVMLQGSTTYPFLFKSLLVYHHLFYKTCISDQWVTISGAHLQPSGDPNFLIFSNNSSLPLRVYELYPTTAADQRLEFPTTVYPFYYRGVSIYRDRRYKIQVSGRYVVVFGSQLHPGNDCVLMCQGPGRFVTVTEIHPYEVTFQQGPPANTHQAPSQPYQQGPPANTHQVPGQPYQQGPPANTHQVPSQLYQPAQPTNTYHSVQQTHSFVFSGLPIYPHAYYKILIRASWVIVQGSQLSLSPDGSAVIYYQDPTSPITVTQIIAVSSDSTSHTSLQGYGRPSSPQRRSPTRYSPSRRSPPRYSPTYPQPSYSGFLPSSPGYIPTSPGYIPPSPHYKPSSPGYKPPSPHYKPSSPDRRRVSPQPPANNYYHQQTSEVIKQTSQNISQQPTPAPTQPALPSQEIVKPYDPIKNTVPPSDRDYPFLFKGLNIHSDRMYKVKIDTVWEVVHGYQLHPAKNDPNSLIVNFANFNSAIITDIFVYQPERYTPVTLIVKEVSILPDQRYYVDLGSAGALIVPGSMIQRHTTRRVGMVWYEETYHEIVDLKVIVNSDTTDNTSVEVLREGVKEVGSCTCQTQSCTILPLHCPNCTPNPVAEQPALPPIPPPQPPLPQPLPPPPPPPTTSPPGILRSSSRTTTVIENNSISQQKMEKKSVSVNEKKTIQITSSSPDEEETTTSSSISPQVNPSVFKNIQILPDSLYSALLENNTTIIVSGKFIQTKRDRKYVKVEIDNELYKSYFIRPVSPEEDEVTPKNTGFYRIYLNGKWRLLPDNNVRPSKRRPGRYVVIFNNKKYIVKAVSVVPVSLPGGGNYPDPQNTTLSPVPCSSPVHPHPISPEQHAARTQRSVSPDYTLHPSLKDLNYLSSSDSTPGVEELPPGVVTLSSLYDPQGQLKPQYASLLGLRDPGVGVARRGTTPLVLLPTERANLPHLSSQVSNSLSNYNLQSPIKPTNCLNPNDTPVSPARNDSANTPYINPTFNNISRAVEKNSTSPIPMVINGTLVFPDKQYILTIESVSYVVTGKQFKPRKQVPGQFTVKAGDCRLIVPNGTAIIPYVPAQSPTKTVKFAACPGRECTAEDVSESDDNSEPGFLALVRGCWVRVGPKAVRPSKTQAGYAVVKYKDSVSLILERDVHPLKPLEDVINLECKLADGRRLLRTWFVERLPANCLDYIRSVSTELGEDPVFVLRNSGTRNINDKDIRKVTTCIRTHFEGAQVIFEDDYLQLAEDGFGVRAPIWVNVRRNKGPHYYKLLEDLTDKSYMDVSLSDNSYIQTMTTCNEVSRNVPTCNEVSRNVPTSNVEASMNVSTCNVESRNLDNARNAATSTAAAQRSTYSSSLKFTGSSSRASSSATRASSSATTTRKSTLFNRINKNNYR